MKKPAENLMRIGAWIGGAFVFLLMGCTFLFVLSMMLMENATAATAAEAFWPLLPKGLERVGFTITTALAAVALSFPMAWALASLSSFMMKPRAMHTMRNVVSGLSAIPAVVYGYLSLNYFTPYISSAWWGVAVTLMLMSLMRQTLELINVNERYFPAVEAAQAMGTFTVETLLHYVVPCAKRDYLNVALRTFVRCMGEGVAILLVLSAYWGGSDTLATALMKAMGVTGEEYNLRWVLMLTLMAILLVILTNAVISYCLEGGRHGKKKTI